MKFTGKSVVRFFLSPTGRIKRLHFLFGMLPLSIFLYVSSKGFSADQIENLPVLLAMLAFILALLWSYWILHIKRLHDVNLSGWLSLLNLIPIINIFFFLFLLFKKAVDPNKYDRTGLKEKTRLET